MGSGHNIRSWSDRSPRQLPCPVSLSLLVSDELDSEDSDSELLSPTGRGL